MNRKLAVAAVIASLMLAACGGTTTTQPVTQARLTKAQTKVVIEWDGSGFARFANLYKEELTALIQKLAAHHDDVLSVVLDGQPITTAKITTTDFASSLSQEEVEKEEEPEDKQAIAKGLATTLIARAKETVPGSGQLQGLELAANTPGISRVYQWTDGIVNEPSNHFNLTSATQTQIAAEIRQWHPHLKGLKGKTVVIIGAGQGVHAVSTVERAHQLFNALVNGNGGHLVWTQTLAQSEN